MCVCMLKSNKRFGEKKTLSHLFVLPHVPLLDGPDRLPAGVDGMAGERAKSSQDNGLSLLFHAGARIEGIVFIIQ